MSFTVLELFNNVSAFGWVVVAGGIFSAVLSGIIFWQDTTRQSNRLFFLFGFVNFVWGIVYAIFEGLFSTPDANTGVVMLYGTAVFIPTLLSLFLYVFSLENRSVSFLKIVVYFIPTVVIIGILYLYPSFIVSYQRSIADQSGKIIFEAGFSLYVFYVLAYLAIGPYFLIKKYRESAGIFKTVIHELLTAVWVSCGTAVIMALFSPLFGDWHDLFWVGHFAIILLVIITSYILIKYNFWNIKIIATELLVSITILIFIVELFFANSPLDLFVRILTITLVIFSSIFLVRSVRREMQSGERIMGLMYDISEISKRLKFLDRKKTEFLSVASHHLRDPLTSIRGYTSMLKEGSFGELTVGVKEALDKIYVSSEHLITMISDFMDVARIEGGDMQYVFSDVDMKKLVVELSSEMKGNAEQAHIIFSTTIDDVSMGNESFITVGDAGKLRQVISNLVDNSIKYTPEGEVSVLLSKSKDKRKILFSVSDTGIGMNDTTKGKIFNKFSRAEGVSKVYTEGTGLGLYVAKEIVKKHEGRIWAESKGEGQGSTFFVELEAKM